MTITIADGRGALWQWDTGRRLRVGSGVEQIHYQNRALGCSVDVDVGTDGTAIIPDELLQDCHTLTAYAYVTDDTGAYTMAQRDFIVHKRAKPAGYVYTPTDQMTLQTIQRQIGDLSDLTTAEKDTLVAAINEAAASGDVDVDNALSATSANPVQNKAITAALAEKAGTAVATASANGLMSAADKTKLDGTAADTVRYGAAQTLTEGQKSQARDNIDAPCAIGPILTSPVMIRKEGETASAGVYLSTIGI